MLKYHIIYRIFKWLRKERRKRVEWPGMVQKRDEEEIEGSKYKKEKRKERWEKVPY
jgi:hypothetical protein